MVVVYRSALCTRILIVFNQFTEMNRTLKIAYKSFLLGSAVFIIVGCSKDLGNYHYQEINELEIQGVAKQYLVRSGIDTLRIRPDIGATLDDGADPSRYEHLWILRYGTTPPTLDTIGREKNLEYPVRLSPTPHELFYRVKDKKTGITWIANTKINVSTVYSRGFLIMGEDDRGNAEAEMLSMVGDTVHIRNILSLSGLPPLQGPITLQHTSGTASYSRLWAMTESGSYVLDLATLEGRVEQILGRYLFTSETLDPDGLHPVALAPQIRTADGAIGSTLYRALVTKGGDVFANVPLLMAGDFYNNPVNRIAPPPAPRLPAAPFLMYPIGSMNNVMWYDTQNQRFLNYTSIGVATVSNLLPDDPGDVFPWNQPGGRVLVYAENTRNTDGGSTQGNSFAIMKDADNMHHIYKFYANGTNPAKRAAYTVKPLATDFDKATYYAFSSNRTVIFYAVGSKLYAYDYNPGFEKLYTFPNLGGDAITMLKFDTQLDHVTNSLYIATYDTVHKGTLERFLVGTNPNVVELLPQPNSRWTGLIRIKDINWRAIN